MKKIISPITLGFVLLSMLMCVDVQVNAQDKKEDIFDAIRKELTRDKDFNLPDSVEVENQNSLKESAIENNIPVKTPKELKKEERAKKKAEKAKARAEAKAAQFAERQRLLEAKQKAAVEKKNIQKAAAEKANTKVVQDSIKQQATKAKQQAQEKQMDIVEPAVEEKPLIEALQKRNAEREAKRKSTIENENGTIKLAPNTSKKANSKKQQKQAEKEKLENDMLKNQKSNSKNETLENATIPLRFQNKKIKK